ncbi:E3 ubiquitin-protein ligase SMURF2-like [Tetranychus urticae]|uniref:HECT-type E3 ubiquitin transferase n=1 Tax=Tetranychus urticae TaxID=32264 RepID=T1L0X7_TETUR|nr:E3 ubiquitin-protein ligase SMURF2-like [Tetranychus urticae]
MVFSIKMNFSKVLNLVNHSHNNNSNNNQSHSHNQGNSSSSSLSTNNHSSRNENVISGRNHQRRSTRHSRYLSRNQLHSAAANVSISPPPPPPPSSNLHPVNLPPTTHNLTCANNGSLGSSTSPIGLPEGYEMRIAPKGQVYFHHVPTSKSTWHDPRVPRELLNQNFDLDKLVGKLPSGWEIRTISSGDHERVYFVDHNRKTTQFTDPRLVANPDILKKILRERPNLCYANVEKTPKHSGRSSNGADPHIFRESCKRKNLVQKMAGLRQELQEMQPQTGHCRLEVSRKDIFEDSYRAVMKKKPKDLMKRLIVTFKGEEGLDYGGLAREWLYLLSHEMLNPQYGLFQYTREDVYTLQINRDSSVNPDHLTYFHFVGRIIGMAIFHGHYIDGGFTLPFYKMLLNKSINLEDIQVVDPELYRSLCWMLENNLSGVLETTFSVEHNSFGHLQVHELKPNGKNIPVTDENKREYVKLYVNYRFRRGIGQQFHALQKGLNELVPTSSLQIFDEKELELVISGLGNIDINDWKSNTRLKHCTPDTPVVKWFWQAVESYAEERRARLLQFVTGSSRVPLQGFKALQGSTGASGPRLFTIHLIEASSDNLPKAHTCFNRIDLPPYETYEKLYEKLTQAIEETCGFAVE